MTAATSKFRDVRVLAVTPTVDDTPNYTDGDNMGGLMSFTGGPGNSATGVCPP